MEQQTASCFEPRKSPVQARSTASVDAILKATIQVLLKVGKEKLTTTRVAARAGVSVGTLIQQLRCLERDGIVQRTVHPRVPPKVEYQLTSIGKALSPTLRALLDWTYLRKRHSLD